jgi:hypothetical protein
MSAVRRPSRYLPAASAAKGEQHPTALITALDLDAKARERLNSGVRSVLLKETFRPADLVERIRRLADKRAAANSGIVSAS